MTTPRDVQGIIPVVHTPFRSDDSIDSESLERQLDWAQSLAISGYCTGMVSELLRLTFHERCRLTEQLVAARQPSTTVVISVGAESTKQAVEFARHAEESGADAVMAIPPISAALPDDEIYAYFAKLASAVELPVIVQDASSYVGKAIGLDVYGRLLDEFGERKVLFKPEAAPAGPNLSRLLELTSGRARVFEGSGGVMLVDNFRRGIVGAIPGMEFLPLVMGLWEALQSGDEKRTYQLYLPLCALVSLQLQAGLDGFLAIEKYVLHKRGLFTTDIRRHPYSFDLDSPTVDELERLLAIAETALAQ